MYQQESDIMYTLCDLQKELNEKEYLLVELKFKKKILGEYTVSSKGILGSITTYFGIDSYTIKKSYENTNIEKVKDFWKGKINIFDLLITKMKSI